MYINQSELSSSCLLHRV